MYRYLANDHSQLDSIPDPAIRHAACFRCLVDGVLVMFAFVFNLSVSLRIDRSFVANASIGADRHVSGSVARATMQAFFQLSTRSVSPAPPFKD